MKAELLPMLSAAWDATRRALAQDALDPKYLEWQAALKKAYQAKNALEKAERTGDPSRFKLKEKWERLEAEQKRLADQGWTPSSQKIIGGRDEEPEPNNEGSHAAGVLFVAPDGDVLLLRRGSNEENFAGHWALPGGKAEEGESPEQAADRESNEEMGAHPAGNKKLLDRKTTPTGMTFHTFTQPVSHKFTPKLNAEHSGFAWAPLSLLPQPLHPAVADTLSQKLGGDKPAADMTPEDWSGLKDGLMKFLSEEEQEAEHAEDANKFEQAILTSANSIKKLRRSDVYRVLDENRHVSGLAEWIKSKRSDLAKEVDEAKAELANDAELANIGHPPKSNNPKAKPTGTEGEEDADSDGAMDARKLEHGKHGLKENPIGKTVVWTINGKVHKGRVNSVERNSSTGAILLKTTDGDVTSHVATLAEDCSLTQDAQKFSHTTVAYGPGQPESHCGICRFFHDQGCELVVDPIERFGWCKLFTADSEDAVRASDKTALDEKVLQLALDRCISASGGGPKYALDLAKGSVREYDADGHLHVKRTPISKSNICPYLGEEIPDEDGSLKLDPKKVYHLLRHPAELEKAAATSNGKPLMREHVPVSADDHKPYDVIGATGNDAEWDEPYLYNSLVIWPQDDIDLIESKEKVQLSAGYRYTPVMQKGVYKGEPYDGIMTALVFNHIAQVSAGRAGRDVRVLDSVNPNVGWAAIEAAILELGIQVT